VEPHGLHRAGVVLDEGLQAVGVPRRPHVDDPAADGLLPALADPGDGHRAAPVHVLARKKLEGVAHGPHTQPRQKPGPLRAHPLQVLDAVAEFGHAGRLPQGT